MSTNLMKDTKLSLLMKSLTEFYKDETYINEIKNIVNQDSILSLRILDWFITNYSKKFKTLIKINKDDFIDVYMQYKIMLKGNSKRSFDPFCRKNKIIFYYTDNDYIETSCGQLCFFKWCFENTILDYVKKNLNIIEDDMKNSLKVKKDVNTNTTKKRQPLSIPVSRSISKQQIKYTLKFD
jgi:hypothetical protein